MKLHVPHARVLRISLYSNIVNPLYSGWSDRQVQPTVLGAAKSESSVNKNPYPFEQG